MTKLNINSLTGFRYGIIGLGLIIVLIISTQFLDSFKSDFVSILIGLLTFAIGVIGFINSLKGIKEPNTMKKIVGITINFGIVLLFLSIIFANVYDILRAFNSI